MTPPGLSAPQPAAAAPPEENPDSKVPPAAGGGSIFLWMLAVVGCVTVADLLLKRGASSPAVAGTGWLQLSGVGALASPYTIAGIFFHLLGLAAWMRTLQVVPLAVAYCFTAAQQATIALGAWLWLGESISPLRWIGIALVLAGVLALVPAIAASNRAGPRGALP